MSIKDKANPELIKEAKKFTKMIKDGTIKNEHAIIYQEKLTYKEAEKLAYSVKWKVVKCLTQHDCWCSMIIPVKKIMYQSPVLDDFLIEEFCIVPSGCINTKLAKYIVKLHNDFLNKKA